MKRFGRNIIILFCLFCCIQVFSQEYNDYTLRKINMEALSIIDEYRRQSLVFERRDFERFSRLFTNNDVLIANDVLPDNNLNEQIRLMPYARLLGQKHDRYDYTSNITPIYISPTTFNPDGYTGSLQVYVQKIIDATSRYGIWYGDTLFYDFTIAFDSLYYGNFHIADIRILEERGKYCIIEAYEKTLFRKTKLKNEYILINGKHVLLDEQGRYFLKDIKDDFIVEPANDQLLGFEIIKPEEIGLNESEDKDKNITEVEFRQPYLFVAADLGYTPFFMPSIYAGSDLYNIQPKSSSNNLDASIYLGLILYQNLRYQYMLSLGANYKSIEYLLNLGEYNLTYIDIDPDDWEYERIINLSDVSETHILSLISFPLKLQTTVALKNQYFLNISINATYYQSIDAKYGISAKGQYSGYYPDLFNITIAENGIYDFGSYSLSDTQNLDIKESFIGYGAGVGLLYKLSRRYYLDFSLNYTFTLDEIYNFTQKDLSINNTHINSLTNITNEFYFNRLSANIGFLIKL